jgi:aquaporin Z
MKKYVVEGIGTFFWVLTILLTLNNDNISGFAPLAIGAMLIGLIYASGHTSSAYYNPAVTLAMLMRDKLDRTDAFYYILSQFVAALLATFLGVFLHLCQGGKEISLRSDDVTCAMIGEFLGTFVVTWVALQVVSPRNTIGSSHSGLAIGLTVMAAGYTLGNLSGGAFNPAVAFAYCMSGMVAFGDLWFYWVGSILGAAAAATIFQVLQQEETAS